MTLTNEQIQALKADAEKASGGDWIKESGDGWEAVCSADDQANEGFIIAHFEGPDSAVNRKFIQAANPAVILSLLAEREADKALIDELKEALEKSQEQSSKWLEAYHKASSIGARYEERIAELEARTLTVTFDPIPMGDLGNKNEGKKHPYMFGAGYNSAVVSCKCALENACASAGITLVVGGE